MPTFLPGAVYRVKSQTEQLLKGLQGGLSTRAKLNLLHGAYRGETAFIVASGPSLKDYSAVQLNRFLSDKLVLAVKRSYQLVGSVADFHLLNGSSLQKYSYSEKPPIRIFHGNDNAYDVSLPMIPGFKAEDFFKNNLALNHEFGLWTLEDTIYRIPACGIVPTIGFYTALHLGVSRIVTIGMDLSTDGYFDSSDNNYRNQFNIKEIECAARSLPAWCDWLSTKGVQLARLETTTPVKLSGMPVVNVSPAIFEKDNDVPRAEG